ncbi:MAG: biotin--[acetyl-CoA-carboxylase] ligase [Defluviitaleaceae bacterium]|nr:biotin--[acetyl-CoA-carboxylase] ligase [Defluviitaleaceae bacterium]
MEIIYTEETQSTNADLKAKCRDKTARNGMVIFAHNQTGGYGRYGKNWHHERDCNIAFSIALCYDSFEEFHGNISDSFETLALVGGVAVAWGILDFVDESKIGLKWPNDVLLDGKKVCGILVEKLVVEDVKWYILGIGINVNNAQMPNELAETATSLYLSTGKNRDIMEVFHAVLRCISTCFGYGLTEKYHPRIMQEYRKFCVHLGKDVKILVGNKEIIGKNIDVNNHGTIIIQNVESGELHNFSSGEISLRSKEGV